MKRNSIFILTFPFLLLFSHCSDDEPLYMEREDHLFIGYWEQSGYSDSTLIFSRRNALVEDSYGMAILKDGSFIENANSGWCGTPPISYSRYSGTWLETGKDSLLINTRYWGGAIRLRYIIQSVTEKKLEIKSEVLEVQEEWD